MSALKWTTALPLLCVLPASAAAQVLPGYPAPGTEVRVVARGIPIQGVIVTWGRDTIRIGRTNDTVVLATDSVTEASRRMRAAFDTDRVRRGAVIGAGIGAMIGAAAGAVTAEECGTNDFMCFGPGGGAVAGGVVGALAGGAIGATIGALVRGSEWRPVPLRARLAVAPRPGGWRMAVAIPVRLP